MENAPLAAFVKNRQGQYIEVNPATCELFGLTKVEIQGKTDLEVLPRRAAEVMRRGDVEVLQTGRQTGFYAEVTLRGERVFLRTTKYPVLDVNGKATAVVGLSRDVTAQKEAEAALTRTREYLQHILANSPMMIVTTDLEGHVVSFNPEAEARLGYAAEDIIGEPAVGLYRDPEEMEGLQRRVQRDGLVEEWETVMLHRDGAEVPAALTLSQLKDTHREVIGTVVIGRDISSRQALVNQVIQSERLAAVGRLAAGVAHEINNPLAVISEVAGYLDDLVAELPESLPELQEELVSGLPKILAHVRRGRSITSRLLSFARKSEARVEEADVNASLEEILPFLEKQARLANVVIERSFQADLPRVRIEELQLQEVLINLITNSIQAMSDRHHGTIWLGTESLEGRVVVTVRDDGPGISEEVRDRLFDPFVSTKPLGVGTGLGLSICYGIIKRYDGEIRVESRAGEGATFKVLLPVHRQAGEASP
jgi:PAS domain S-box-containing protein